MLGGRPAGVCGQRQLDKLKVSSTAPGRLYQACSAPQCGQLTLVETLALNRQPQAQL
jgi:hypothetical protein